MTPTTEWQIDPAVAHALSRLGWLASEAPAREIVAAVARGGNVVAVLPPSPAWGDPIIATLLGDGTGGPVLILAAPASVGEWAVAVGSMIETIARPLAVDVLREPHRATKSPAHAADIVIASPVSALASHERSALRPDRFRAIVFAWPEYWRADDAVAAILQDCSREAQRVVLTGRTTALDAANGLIERYARKAIIVEAPVGDAGLGRAEIRSVTTSWAARPQITARLLDLLGRESVTIWTADTRDHQLIQRAMGSLPDGVHLTVQSAPDGGTVICYDLPTTVQLAAMGRAAEIAVLVPPGVEEYVSDLAPVCRPLSLDSPAMAIADHDAALRQQLVRVMERDENAAALYALAPLFEQWDPQRVAAALFSLWQKEKRELVTPGTAGGESPASARAPAAAPAPRTATLWIGAGKRDEATVGDFVAVLVKEAGVDRSRIGRIELRDTFALVEVPAEQAEEIARRLAGVTIRKRRLMARVDRGRGKDAGGRRP
ncbi:MAG: DbpA RNA binding domain-containing protein [Gemmatimonadales bacterium]